MTWWIWVIAGVLLLGMELTFISAEFYLLFVGAAAVVTGLATAACPNCPLWASWSLFIALSLVSVKLFRGTLAERFHVSGLPPPGALSASACDLAIFPYCQTCQATMTFRVCAIDELSGAQHLPPSQ